MTLKIASTSVLHFSGASGPVRILRAEKMTMQIALQYWPDQQSGCARGTAKDDTIDQVWVVVRESVHGRAQ
jgi:hypothetical protein